MASQTLYTLGEASEKIGVSAQNLRRLCNSGMIRGIKRNHHGRRVLSEEQLNLAVTLIKLRECRLKPRELRKYAKLYYQGVATKAERKAILDTRRRQLWQEIEARQAAIDTIERQEELLDK